MTRQHYVYRITDIKNNMYYYGTRTTSKKPKDDIGIYYFSSSTNKEFIRNQKNNPQDFKYKVIKIFKNRKDALNLEIKLHAKFDVGVNEKFYNKAKQTSTGFDTTGKKINVLLYNIRNKKIGIIKKMQEETKAKLRNKVNVITPEGEKLHVSCNDENYLNGTYISINKAYSEKNGKELGKWSALGRKTNFHIFKNTIITGQQLANINNVKNMRKIRPNGKTGYENREETRAKTINKEFIDENGVTTTIKKQASEKHSKIMHAKSKKYNLYHIEIGLIAENIPAYKLRKIHQSLVGKLGKSNYLGRTPASRQKHINNGNSILIGLYSELV